MADSDPVVGVPNGEGDKTSDLTNLVEDAGKAFLRNGWDNLWARDRARVLANAPKTLWLFGAGASYHYKPQQPWHPRSLGKRFLLGV